MNDGAYNVGFLMDAYESLNLDTETSLLCMDELMARGHRVYWLEQSGLVLANRGLEGSLSRVESTVPFRRDDTQRLNIADLDALVIRKDPPFDNRWLHLTYLLEFLDPRIVQINSPVGIRHINEKVYTLKWADYCPDTLVSMNIDRLVEFAARHRKVVVKPLGECSGRGIRFLNGNNDDLRATIETIVEDRGFIMVQEFLDAIREGDKRIYLVNGEPVGWVNRIPALGSDLANIHQGTTCRATALSARERAISNAVGKDLLEQGILMAGLDFIGERLTEINVTSPSAVRQINEVEGGRLEQVIVDGIVAFISAGKMPVHSGEHLVYAPQAS